MMCARLSRQSGPERILVVSMTNIGDVVLSCPVIDILRRDFPNALVDVVTGPKAVSLFEANPACRVKMFDKQAPISRKWAWFSDLRRQRYDCVVDLRRTMLPLLLSPKYATPVLATAFEGHKKDIHLNRLRQVYDFDALLAPRHAILTTNEDEQFFKREVAPSLQDKSFVVIAPGAADAAKRWHIEGFAPVADQLSKTYKIVLVGDAKDAGIIDDIQRRMKTPVVSLAGRTNLRQLAFVLKQCAWAMTHDSGVMHLASYFNVPLVVLWGPTDIIKYAPWSGRSVVVRRNENCRRCHDPRSRESHNCMSFITVEDVLNAVRRSGFERTKDI